MACVYAVQNIDVDKCQNGNQLPLLMVFRFFKQRFDQWTSELELAGQPVPPYDAAAVSSAATTYANFGKRRGGGGGGGGGNGHRLNLWQLHLGLAWNRWAHMSLCSTNETGLGCNLMPCLDPSRCCPMYIRCLLDMAEMT